MADRSDRAKNAILRVLAESERPLGASHIAGMALSFGVELQARTIRYHLLRLDELGLTRLVSRRRGRELTEMGQDEASRITITEGLGIVRAKVDTLAYKMSFDVNSGIGTVVVNVSIVHPIDFAATIKEIGLAMKYGLSVGQKICVGLPGDTIGSVQIPEGMLGIGSVCSVTLNGILQKAGIPVSSRFGGLLEIRQRQCTRFLNMIEYGGSTLDPLEVFIRADMTRVRNVALRGSGITGAGFREIPAAAVADVRDIQRTAAQQGLGGFLAIGKPNQPVFGVQVSEGHCGLVLAAGLAPIAAATEAGIRIVSRSLAGLEDYSRFISLQDALKITRNS